MTYIQELEENKNFNGGGLASNITGKFESNRHAIARATKVTFGEAAHALGLKKNGGFKINAKELLDAYWEIYGEPEWHHAGKLPKQYGGGMKKTYFLDEIPTKEDVQEWLTRAEERKAIKKKEREAETNKKRTKLEFAKANGTFFSRISESKIPENSVIESQEMNGKYGWFEAQSRYNLPIYYSGRSFPTEELKNDYLSL